ncbi:MAG: hypothetical protein ACE15B_19220 [Bryobacteraceae bacterium]
MHRSFREKLLYMGVFRCRDCGARAVAPRRYLFYFESRNRCPLCGTEKLRKLNEPDNIDRMHRNLFTLLRPIFRARLFHCRFCRIQFYDVERSGGG